MTLKLIPKGEKQNREWVDSIVSHLEKTIEMLKASDNANGIALCFTHTDGSVSTFYSAGNYFQMIGGLEYMKDEILQESAEHDEVV
jgi:hypothetical protein